MTREDLYAWHLRLSRRPTQRPMSAPTSRDAPRLPAGGAPSSAADLFRYELCELSGSLVVRPYGMTGATSAAHLCDTLTMLMPSHRLVIVDLSQTVRLGLPAVASLIRAADQMRRTGGRLVTVGAPAGTDLAQGRFASFTTVDEAVDALRGSEA